MSDLIDRQAVLNALKEHRSLFCDNTPETFSKLSYAEKSRVDELDTAIATIINLPSVENKDGWNPLKSDEEGMLIGSLPEEGKEVFITVYGQVEIDSFGCEFEYDESVGDYRNKWFCENNDIEDVRAWMPLPEPYKAESEET